VIVMANFNKDIWSAVLQTQFLELGLDVVFTSLHGKQAPATQNCQSLPIDGIFLPCDIIPYCQGGYLDFGNGVPSDHRVIWLDIPSMYICPTATNQPRHMTAWWLQCSDPCIIKQYMELFCQQLLENGMFT